ncbi:hypothetical protein EJ03DRAFT_377582 [Teratosphaeria nubilosa]|uniref:Uncharacterized protein n=1 Tax=Teratosphaeria nubilosa TaxID=161662 RepID=A0A6G1KZE7_9PEZI|nr:hypothetical protein EJ03DRAFT_377582 [Teratosphaeria nubilosa]
MKGSCDPLQSSSHTNKIPTPITNYQALQKMLLLPIAILAGYAAAAKFSVNPGPCSDPGIGLGVLDFDPFPSSSYTTGCRSIGKGTGQSVQWTELPDYYFECIAAGYGDANCDYEIGAVLKGNEDTECVDVKKGIYSMRVQCD